jgi:putative MATE family efflux protein
MAQQIGAGSTDGARNFARDSLIVSVVLMAIVAAVGLLTMDLVFTAIGATGTTLAQVKSFMSVFYPSALVLVIPMVSNGMLRAAGDTRWPAIIMVIVAVLNAALDPLLIFGAGPIPALGLKGAAWATLLARVVSVFIALGILHYRERLISWSRPTWQGLVESLRHIGQIGLPSATTNAITPLATGLVTAVVAGFGDAAVAGLTTAMRIEVCALVGVFALAVGSFPVMAQNYGAGNSERLLTARKFTLSTGVVISLVVAIPVYLSAAPLAGIFISGGLVQETATTFLKIVPWSWAGFALVFMISSIHMATGRPFLGASLTLVRLFVLLIPLTWLLSRHYGLAGVFMAFVLANLLTAMAGLASFYLFKPRTRAR